MQNIVYTAHYALLWYFSTATHKHTLYTARMMHKGLTDHCKRVCCGLKLYKMYCHERLVSEYKTTNVCSNKWLKKNLWPETPTTAWTFLLPEKQHCKHMTALTFKENVWTLIKLRIFTWKCDGFTIRNMSCFTSTTLMFSITDSSERTSDWPYNNTGSFIPRYPAAPCSTFVPCFLQIKTNEDEMKPEQYKCLYSDDSPAFEP